VSVVSVNKVRQVRRVLKVLWVQIVVLLDLRESKVNEETRENKGREVPRDPQVSRVLVGSKVPQETQVHQAQRELQGFRVQSVPEGHQA
jgi:hypothetical protein